MGKVWAKVRAQAWAQVLGVEPEQATVPIQTRGTLTRCTRCTLAASRRVALPSSRCDGFVGAFWALVNSIVDATAGRRAAVANAELAECLLADLLFVLLNDIGACRRPVRDSSSDSLAA